MKKAYTPFKISCKRVIGESRLEPGHGVGCMSHPKQGRDPDQVQLTRCRCMISSILYPVITTNNGKSGVDTPWRHICHCVCVGPSSIAAVSRAYNGESVYTSTFYITY